jgi:hypothetical protein
MRAPVVAAALVLAAAVLASPAHADTYTKYKGQIVTSDQPLPGPSAGDAEWQKGLKKAQKTTFAKEGDGWTVHFIAFMKKPAGGSELNVVFYDITKGKPDQVHFISFAVQASQKTLQSNFKLSTDDPIKADHKYEVRLTRIVGGREDVLAKTTLHFK